MHFLSSHHAHVALRSRSGRAHIMLKLRSNTLKIGGRILGAHIALMLCSHNAQMEKRELKRKKWRSWRAMSAL